ncbi:MAG: Ig-like domain-containing protein [Bacteroidales bacterium]
MYKYVIVFSSLHTFLKQIIRIFVVLGITAIPFHILQGQNLPEGCNPNPEVPFSVNKTHLTVWNGCRYVPIFVKGMNLGVGVPGTFPGQLAASREQYSKWFAQIREAGFNAIRIYTLHYPRFYEELAAFNETNPQKPLYVLQGIWLEENLPGYNNDLHFFTDTFDYQIKETLDCVHGNRTIEPRFGKAYGDYQTDISQWVLGYIIGREVIPREVLATNKKHPNNTAYSGEIFSLPSGNPTEYWVTQRLDKLVQYEKSTYETERPVSFSSWPTLDPLDHQETFPDEDTASIDLANIRFPNSSAGYFASYHAYPYYPDFISTNPYYQSYSDHIGQNSYLGYLHDLKSHYDRFPLIIAEFGVPSSWGVAHYSHSGMNHGGNSEVEQGESNMRLLQNIHESMCGGGIQFSWIDEWWKPTWVITPLDYLPSRRALWHNVTAAEQNFGLLKFEKESMSYETWDTFSDNKPLKSISVTHGYSYFHLRLNLEEKIRDSDSIWIALDTYSEDLGEQILPTGDTLSNRAEFALKITNHDAELYVTQAYDLFGIKFDISSPEQLYRSVQSTGDPWNIVRWKNNIGTLDVQYIGDMNTHTANQPPSSKDAVFISDDQVEIRIPWTLLHFVDPSTMKVIHDDRSTYETEDTTSDGIATSVFYHNSRMSPDTRYTWDEWNAIDDVTTEKKASFSIIKNRINQFNNQPIAFCDSYSAVQNTPLEVTEESGILKNDFDIDGNSFSLGIVRWPDHGTLDISKDGSFTYEPFKNYFGEDSFTYSLYDGFGHSDTTQVFIHIAAKQRDQILIYPNPSSDKITITTAADWGPQQMRIIDMLGNEQMVKTLTSSHETLDISFLSPGTYMLIIGNGEEHVTQTFIVK